MNRAALVPLLAVVLGGQATRDFLTADEVSQVRETAVDPNARLALYTEFARQRIDMIRQTLEKEKPGRSRFVHDTLEDYTKIVETIDVVTEDALKKGKDIAAGLGKVAAVEKELLAELEKIEEANPADMARFRFVLTTAIDATRDSLELSEKDVATRTREAKLADAAEKKKVEALMTPEDAKARRAASEKAAADESKKRKAPTLRRKGEAKKDR